MELARSHTDVKWWSKDTWTFPQVRVIAGDTACSRGMTLFSSLSQIFLCLINLSSTSHKYLLYWQFHLVYKTCLPVFWTIIIIWRGMGQYLYSIKAPSHHYNRWFIFQNFSICGIWSTRGISNLWQMWSEKKCKDRPTRNENVFKSWQNIIILGEDEMWYLMFTNYWSIF